LAINLTKLTKKLSLNLNDVPLSKRKAVKKEVGNFIVEEILRSVSSAKSPVSGGKYKAVLNKDYAKNMKGGNRTANLELEGDMLDALTFKDTDRGIEIGIFKKSEVPKADGHNNFTGKSKLPTRQFIPKSGQTFNRDIENGVASIVNKFKQPVKKQSITTIEQSTKSVAISLNDIFSNDFLQSFLTSEGLL